MKPVPKGFQFSQRSLQDYVDCQRRFQLRYLDQVAWPAVELEPISEHESQMQAGADFHRLVQQYLVGISPERLSAMLASSSSFPGDLTHWWKNFIQFSGILPVDEQLVETSLSSPLHSYRLLAKYDLVRWVKEAGHFRITIYDWKTSRKKPPRQWIEQRLQTRVYPYLLARVGQTLIGADNIQPDWIEMVYWFAEQPSEPHIFAYSSEQFQADHDYLLGLVEAIDTQVELTFPLTDDETKCKFCTYRSLCDRGTTAGEMDRGAWFEESVGGDDFDLDFDQVAEIEF